MISRFFKKKPKKRAAKTATRAAPKKTAKPSPKPAAVAIKPKTEFQKILTAEGWKRLMMKKYGLQRKK